MTARSQYYSIAETNTLNRSYCPLVAVFPLLESCQNDDMMCKFRAALAKYTGSGQGLLPNG